MFKCVAFRAELPPELTVALVSSCSIQPAAMTTIQGQMSGQLPASAACCNGFVRNLITAAFFTLNSKKQQCPKKKMLKHSLFYLSSAYALGSLVPIVLYL